MSMEKFQHFFKDWQSNFEMLEITFLKNLIKIPINNKNNKTLASVKLLKSLQDILTSKDAIINCIEFNEKQSTTY